MQVKAVVDVLEVVDGSLVLIGRGADVKGDLSGGLQGGNGGGRLWLSHLGAGWARELLVRLRRRPDRLQSLAVGRP